MTRRYFALALIACTISSLLAIAASYFCGPSGLSLPAPELQTLRLSRTALACIAGGALSLSGAIFQTLLRNPLADPYIVGVSGGSALFGASALLFGLSSFYVSSSALAGALAVSFMLAWLLSKDKSDNADATLLAGVVFNAFVGAALTLFKTLVPAQKSQELLFWLIGTLTYIDASTIITLSVCIALCALFAFIKSGSLETLNLGESEAKRLGLNVNFTRVFYYLLASVLVALTVPFVGLIGFVGLVVPHAVRLTLNEDARLLLPASFVLGAAALSIADALARLSFPLFHTEIPTGAISALVGAFAFAAILYKRTVSRGHS